MDIRQLPISASSMYLDQDEQWTGLFCLTVVLIFAVASDFHHPVSFGDDEAIVAVLACIAVMMKFGWTLAFERPCRIGSLPKARHAI